jgi:hypothetical protein
MTDDELGYEPAPSQLSSRRRTAIWAATGLLGIGAVGVAIVTEVGGHSTSGSSTVAAGAPTVASSSSPAPAPSGSAAPKRGPGKNGNGGPRGFGGPGPASAGGFGGFGGPGAAGGKTLHSEATVETPKGVTEVVDTQNGKITAISGSTVTVTSTDNVAFTYTVGSTSRLLVITAATAGGKPSVNAKATVADLKVGDTVNVSALRSGDTRTVTALTDGLPTIAARGGAHLGAPGGGPRPHGTASPSPKASPAGATT